MNTEPGPFSAAFQRLYCDADVFATYSQQHPVDFHRVLPLLTSTAAVDDPQLLTAEAAHLARRTDDTRRNILAAYVRCGLISQLDTTALRPVVDYFDADFFELMGDSYANADAFVCALRWYREFIAELEPQNPGPHPFPDKDSVYASVGYCLLSLGLFAEAIAWTRSCSGPRLQADIECRALMEQAAQSQGGCLRCIDRASNRTRYVVSAADPVQADEQTPQLIHALRTLAPFQESYIDWMSSKTPVSELEPVGYPFLSYRDAGYLTRHRLNLLYALCGQADALTAQGQTTEAKALLSEAAILEPRAVFIQNRLNESL